MTQKPSHVLYVIVCAAGPASHIQDFVTCAQASDWDVYLIPTPNAIPFLDIPLLTTLTGHPIRSEARSPENSGSTPPCDALVVVAGTFNTINKFALGIADNRALTILCENLGRGRPILVVPCVNQQHLARHPAFFKSLSTLREWGISVLYDLEKYPPRNEVPWDIVLEELERITKAETGSPS